MEDFDDFIIEQVKLRIEILKEIDPYKHYTAAELCADFWKGFETRHIEIGRRIKALSKRNQLPIKYVNRTSCNKQLYELQ